MTLARIKAALRNLRAAETPPEPSLDAVGQLTDAPPPHAPIRIYPIVRSCCGGCGMELRGLFAPQGAASRLGYTLCDAPQAADLLLILGGEDGAPAVAAQSAMDAAAWPMRVVAIGDCAAQAPSELLVEGCPPSPRAILAALRAFSAQRPKSGQRTGTSLFA